MLRRSDCYLWCCIGSCSAEKEIIGILLISAIDSDSKIWNRPELQRRIPDGFGFPQLPHLSYSSSVCDVVASMMILATCVNSIQKILQCGLADLPCTDYKIFLVRSVQFQEILLNLTGNECHNFTLKSIKSMLCLLKKYILSRWMPDIYFVSHRKPVCIPHFHRVATCNRLLHLKHTVRTDS